MRNLLDKIVQMKQVQSGCKGASIDESSGQEEAVESHNYTNSDITYR